MITLTAGDILYGSSSLGTATVSVFGDEFTISTPADSFKLLYQGQPAVSPGVLATVPADKQWLIRSIHVVNTSGVTQQFSLFVNGTAAANRIIPDAMIAVSGFAVYSSDAWRFYDSSGQVLTVGNTGPTGPQGPSGPATFLDAEPGDEGAQGPPGPKGDTGNTGSQGETGPAVFLDAEPGEEGQPGVPGSKGDTGAQGPTGPATFLEAEPGDEGAQGPPGSKGDTGAQGPTGPATFLDAEPGEEGQPGAPGSKGDTGATGAQGPTGPAIFLEAEPGEEGPMGPPSPNFVLDTNIVEVDYGATKTRYKKFTITDSAVTTNSIIYVTQSGAAATGKTADEVEMDPIIAFANPAAGSFTLVTATKDGPVTGKFKFNYLVS